MSKDKAGPIKPYSGDLRQILLSKSEYKQFLEAAREAAALEMIHFERLGFETVAKRLVVSENWVARVYAKWDNLFVAESCTSVEAPVVDWKVGTFLKVQRRNGIAASTEDFVKVGRPYTKFTPNDIAALALAMKGPPAPGKAWTGKTAAAFLEIHQGIDSVSEKRGCEAIRKAIRMREIWERLKLDPTYNFLQQKLPENAVITGVKAKRRARKIAQNN